MVTGRTLLFLAIVTLWLAKGQTLPSERPPKNSEPADDECDQGHDELLCASNDVTYLNLCEFQKALVKNPGLKLIENAACICDPVERHEWDPLCASNGQSYANNCELMKARKLESLHIKHLGLCNSLLKRNTITLREVQKLKMWHSFMPKRLYETLSNRDVADGGSPLHSGGSPLHSDYSDKKKKLFGFKQNRNHRRGVIWVEGNDVLE